MLPCDTRSITGIEDAHRVERRKGAANGHGG